VSTTQNWHDVGAPQLFPEEEPVAIVVDGTPVAVFRQGEELFALHDLCTHGAARLSEGYVEDGCVECPLHQGTFDLRTGAACRAPVTEGVKVFPIRILNGRVEVCLSELPTPS
jgi:anthranilate 1,2-dioxygenase ferredoxin component